jgi:hypothetical protein
MVRYYPALLLLSLAVACKKTDDVPAYVEVGSVTLSTTASEQGASTSKITDAWISLNGRSLGVWELPARVPVLATGQQTLEIVPAIKRNGLFDDRLRYPFYAAWTSTIALEPERTMELAPTVTYIPQTRFWIEDFLDPFSRLDETEDSDTTLLRFTPADDPDVTFVDNTPCAGFRLTPARPRVRVFSDEDFDSYGGPAFLEMDHRNDVFITVGVIYSADGGTFSAPLVDIVPTKRSNGSMPWSKIHIDLSPMFNAAVAQRDFYIEAVLPNGQASGEVYFDNIKLLRVDQ